MSAIRPEDVLTTEEFSKGGVPVVGSSNHFPAWCTEPDCRGEHHNDLSQVVDPVPATGGLPRFSRGGGVFFPEIVIGLSWDTIDHLRPSISIEVRSEKHRDSQADMHLHEARALLDALAEAIAVLETSGVPA